VALGMSRPRRSPRSFLAKGGKRWIRVPRPRPPLGYDSDESVDSSDSFTKGYESCDQAHPHDLASALCTAAEPTIKRLYLAGDADAATLIEALCDRLEAATSRAKRLHKECCTSRSALSTQRSKLGKLSNLQGQCARYWKCATALALKCHVSTHDRYLECATDRKHQRPPDWIAAWPGCMQ